MFKEELNIYKRAIIVKKPKNYYPYIDENFD
jgi:hypothetical protein